MRRPISRFALLGAAACLALVAGCGSDDDSVGTVESSSSPSAASAQSAAATPASSTQGGVEVALRDVKGTQVGRVTLVPVDGKVRVEGSFKGLSVSGYHGFHIHQKPLCDADAPGGPFTTAGGHYNPGGTAHGEHAGDLPPLLFDKEGAADVLAETDRFTLAELRQQGAAIIVHADADNLAHIPDRYRATDAPSPGPDERTNATGDGGDRIACGIIPKA